jgi:hypothetical protein
LDIDSLNLQGSNNLEGSNKPVPMNADGKGSKNKKGYNNST